MQQNKILTKDNIIKKGWHRSWQGIDHCLFCNCQDNTDHLFLYCSVATCLWSWFTSDNNFSFHTNTVLELWQIDYCIPYNDSNLCEFVGGVFIDYLEWKKNDNFSRQTTQ